MRILYVFPEPLPLPRARGIQVVHAVAALADLGDDITLAYVPAEGGSDPLSALGLRRPEKLALLPIQRRLPRPLSFLRVHSNKLFAARLARWIDQEVRAGRAPQVILVRHVKLGASLLARFPGIPLAYEAHEVFADTAADRRKEGIAQLERTLVQGASILVANSAATARRLDVLYRPRRPILVLPNGVSLPDAVPPKDWSQRRQRVLYVGSLFGWKGVEDLVAAAARLQGWRITIVGGSPDQIARLRAQAPKNGAELVFLGHRPHAEARRLMEDACIAVLPNRPDPDSAFTSPLKLFEYMAAACAVVASDIPPVREVLGERMAAWFRPGDPESLARALIALDEDPSAAAALAERAFAHVRQFSWRARAERLRAALGAVVAKSAAPE